MTKHDVHFYATISVIIPDVEGEDQLDAVNKAFERFKPNTKVQVEFGPPLGSSVAEAKRYYADLFSSAMVDEVGDEDCSETNAYDLKGGKWVLKKIDMVTPLL